MESSGRICMFCRRAIRQVPSKATTARKPYQQWLRPLSTTSSTIATSSIRSTPRFATPTSSWQGLRYGSLSSNRLLTQPHQFSTSRRQHAATLNPRQDEDGNEMVVEITPRAADRLRQIMTNDANPDLALRITVESGGCHGFQYLMSLTSMAKVSPEEDTVFEGPEGARIVLDEPSLELLKGSKVDYTMELIGSQFKIVDNPLATSSCGCGTSFDIKV